MDSLLVALATLALAIWVGLFFFHADFWRLREFEAPAQPPTTKPSIVAIVPARNEADLIGTALRSLLTQGYGGGLRIFVVDDQSTDGTAEACMNTARELHANERVTIIRGAALPPGWSGKVWAMQQGWEAARAWAPDYFLLTDADVEHSPDNVATLVSFAETKQLDLVSLMVRLPTATIAEKLLIPAFVYFFFLLYPPKRIADSNSRIAGAAGGCMLVRATALQAIAGFESIRGEIIDDCSLAARLKARGGRLWLGATAETRSLRGYGTLTHLRDMIARTAFNQLRHSWLLLMLCCVGLLLTFVAPTAMLFSPSVLGRVEAAIASLLMLLSYTSVLRFYKVSIAYALTLPFAAVFYLYAAVLSAIRYARGQGGIWKGRSQDPLAQEAGSRASHTIRGA
jgi:hopene-associated glycosyltransferase HpnB